MQTHLDQQWQVRSIEEYLFCVMRRSESMEPVAFWSAVSLMNGWANDDHYARICVCKNLSIMLDYLSGLSSPWIGNRCLWQWSITPPWIWWNHLKSIMDSLLIDQNSRGHIYNCRLQRWRVNTQKSRGYLVARQEGKFLEIVQLLLHRFSKRKWCFWI